MKNTVSKIIAAVCALTAVSAAESLSLSPGFMQEKVNADNVLSGDVNKDGVVNAADASLLINYLLGKNVSLDTAAADLNGDGKINIIDEIHLKNKLLNSDTSSKNNDPDKTEATTITLQNTTAKITGNGASVKNGIITISAPGTYSISGKLTDGQIIVNVDKKAYPDGKVELSLEGAEISSQDNSPVYIQSIDDECVITVKKGTENIISDGKEYSNADESTGAVYSKDNLRIKGKGKLTVNGNCDNGIVCKDSLKIFNGDITVNAAGDGIKGKDSVKIGDSDAEEYSNLSVVVNASGDGIKSTNDSEEDKGKVIINGGTVKVTAFGDGIQGETSIKIKGGDLDVYTYQGSAYQSSSSQTAGQNSSQRGGGFGGFGGFMMDGNPNKVPEDLSAKGIKSNGTIDITGGSIKVDSSDDAVHAAGNISVAGGVLELKSADDGLHSDADLVIGAGTADTYDDVLIYIPKCYEGVEAVNITQNSGTVIVYSDDDGFNAAGGADGSGMGGPGGWDQGGWNPGGNFGGDRNSDRPQRSSDDSGRGFGGGFNGDFSGDFGGNFPDGFDGNFPDGFDGNFPDDFGGNFPGDFGGGGGFPGGFGGGGGDYSLNLLGGLAFVSAADGDHDGFDSNGNITIDGAIAISNGNEAFDCDGLKKFASGTYVEISGGGRGFGFGGQSEGFDAAFTSKISAAKGDRITVKDSSGNIIVSFEAGKAAVQVSVGSKTVSDGTVTVGDSISNAKALPVTGDCQQIYVGK